MLSVGGFIAAGALLATGATAPLPIAGPSQETGETRRVPWEHQWTQVAEPREASAPNAAHILGSTEEASAEVERPEPSTLFHDDARRAIAELQRQPSEQRHAGVYHVATGTWTRARQDLTPKA